METKAKSKAELAAELNKGGCNCAQSVFGAFCEKYGLDKRTSMRLASSLGGGAHSGEICGAVSGAVLVIGLKYGNGDPSETEERALCRQKSNEFTKAFRKRKGAIVCRELLGHDTSTPEGKKIVDEEGLIPKICPHLIYESAALLEELGY